MQGEFPLTCCPRSGYGSPRGLGLPLGESGDGRERPPFFLPGAGVGVWRNLHLRHTPWGEGRSLPQYPCREARYEESGRPVRALQGVRFRHVVRDPGMTTGDTCHWGPQVQVDFRRPLGRGPGPNPGGSELGTAGGGRRRGPLQAQPPVQGLGGEAAGPNRIARPPADGVHRLGAGRRGGRRGRETDVRR